MDPKAAAKSKRSQSLQGKRNHPTPSAASAHKKKEPLPQSKQPQHSGVQRSRHRHQHNLPSNWDRYDSDEDNDAVVEENKGGSGTVGKQAGEPAAKVMQPLVGGADALAPKSKGADFRYLIEQARSQPRDPGGYGDGGLVSTSLSDETVPDFLQGLTSIISVKGESLLSWCSNDNFTVDNDARSSFEVPFLSMDVQAVAAQLSKLSMAQRLFIEEDILPTELHADKLDENNIRRFVPVEPEKPIERKHCLAEDAFLGAEKEQVTDGQSKSKAVAGHDSVQRSGNGLSPPFSQGQGVMEDLFNSLESLVLESNRHGGESGSIIDKSKIHNLTSKFEAAEAETELDCLLDSFAVTNSFLSSGLGSNALRTGNALDHLAHIDAVSPIQGSSSSSKAGAVVSLGDAVDEILAESHASCSPGVREDFGSSSSMMWKPRYRSTDERGSGFSDSRHILPLEKSIDDLLTETSFFHSSGIDGQSDGGWATRPRGNSVDVDVPYPRVDHDSRHAAASTIPLDETIDDLLAETSIHLKNQGPSRLVQGKSHVAYDKPTVSKALDDIDTWLDSI